MDLGLPALIIVSGVAFLAGISRTGIPGMGMLLVPIVAMVMPVRASTGFLLLIFVEADLIAVLFFRRRVVWSQLFRVLPWTLAGVVLGFFAMHYIDEATFKPLLGGMIVAIVALDFLRRRAKIELVSGKWYFSAVAGVLAGVFTMMANAAGPIMTIYLLSMNLPKEEFIGTGVLFYCIINLVKLPFSIALGIITLGGVKVDLMLIPLIALGCLAGVQIMKRVSQRHFNSLAQTLAGLGGIKLLF
ncbi:MAG: sulfite exporter TauE/SafE family protein [Spirochaetota bacterium]